MARVCEKSLERNNAQRVLIANKSNNRLPCTNKKLGQMCGARPRQPKQRRVPVVAATTVHSS